MSAPVAAYRRLRRQLRPHQYNLVFFLWIGLVMLSGTLYSIYYQTHLFNTEYSATRALDYTAAKAMHADVPSMFADRRNWMNTLFVKRAWFWNTLVVLLVAVTLDPASGGVRGEKARGVVFRGPQTWREVLGLKPLVRLVTQWCFGPSIIDRIMANTGGQCMINAVAVDPSLCYTRTSLTGVSNPRLFAQLPDAVQEMGLTHPLYAGWHGGHDVSGHTFILVLGMLLLIETLIPFVPYVLPSFSYFRESIPHALYATNNVFRVPSKRARIVNIAVMTTAMLLLTLWSSMLFLTSIYFHHPGEKITGFLAAVAVWLLMPKQSVLH